MLILSKKLRDQLLAHCMREAPDEACGILAGQGQRVQKAYEMVNVDKTPSSFFMDAGEQLQTMKEIRSQALEMVAIYHSHVATPAYPSAHDLELAFYPEVSYVIISLEKKDALSIRSFKIKDEKITEEEVSIA